MLDSHSPLIDPGATTDVRASLEPLLRPRSVAVIGAGRRRGNVGHETLVNLVNGGFQGPVFPVNPNAEHVACIPAYRSVSKIPVPVDLAIVAVPSDVVLTVVEECLHVGIKGFVVFADGFADLNEIGVRRQEILIDLIRRADARLIGPNCLGLINTDPAISLYGTFAAERPLPGRIALMSQSGAIGIEAMQTATRARLGISTFVSAGNKADVSANDLLEYWEHDPATAVIMLYLESIGNPGRFSAVARRVGHVKPIVAVKSGNSGLGVVAAGAHSGAARVDAWPTFEEIGVIRVDTVEDMVEVALVLDRQALPTGRSVAIVGNSGGPAVMTVDAGESAGLRMARFSERTRGRLAAALPRLSHLANPVDLRAEATAADYESALEVVLDDENIDSVVVIFTQVLPTQGTSVIETLERLTQEFPGKTMVACFIGAHADRSSAIPCFGSPERAVRALSYATEYSQWRWRPNDVA